MNTIPLVFNGSRYTIGHIKYENAVGLVAFLDALGVKGIWQTKDTKKVLDDWSKVYDTFSDDLKPLDINLFAFSDTFIISMRGHSQLISRPWRFVEIFCKAIIPPFMKSMRYDFFFRGAIALGRFSRSSRILIGPAVDEAAEFYDVSDWIGISVCPPTSKILNDNIVDAGSNDFLVRYNIPRKTNTGMEWALDWPCYDRDGMYLRILQENASLYANDPLKYKKYKNTLDFYSFTSTSGKYY